MSINIKEVLREDLESIVEKRRKVIDEGKVREAIEYSKLLKDSIWACQDYERLEKIEHDEIYEMVKERENSEEIEVTADELRDKLR